jgi:hypothetical protein
MACVILDGGMVHSDNSITQTGLRRVLRTMRWSDLEKVAEELEVFRKGGTEGKSSRPVTASVICEWLSD